jgi:hypothetical protein
MNDKNRAVSGAEEVTSSPKKKIRFGITLKLSLAIISLVSVIILTIAIFIVYRESDILKEQVFNFVQREVVHLSNTAQQTIGFDELTLSDTVNELKKIDFLKYVFVLNSNNEIIYYFDRRGKDGETKHDERTPLGDAVQRIIDERSDKTSTEIKDYPDESGKGKIYDFSKIVLSRVDNKTKTGVVIIGMSDLVIRKEIENVKKLIMIIFLGFLVISIAGTVILATIIIRPVKKLTQGATVLQNRSQHIR